MTEEARLREPTISADLFNTTFFGLNMGEKLGALEARLVHVEKDVSEIKGDLRNLNAKVEAVVQAVSHLDARLTAQEAGFNEKFTDLKKTVSDNSKALWGMFIALMAAIIVQKFI